MEDPEKILTIILVIIVLYSRARSDADMLTWMHAIGNFDAVNHSPSSLLFLSSL